MVGTVGSAEKIEVARSFGYDEVILRENISSAGEFDIVVDMVGGPARRASLDRLRPLGRMIVMGNASGAEDSRLRPRRPGTAEKPHTGIHSARTLAAQEE
ncbi:zinc-binding dehydrogenase [Nocardia nova]|uniref:zinc-binding dehydrogenase n=1 Tax=Nocardia nova TaxID=37330 RepID=UPI001CA5ED69